ncbi:alpha/beta hydrolase [Salibacterium aidingense]|uniref:alpha/beta hydrolase n=1 Tax=Salibacterium aidingense TaxID=384933 RepID=UPI000403E7DE|nr:alpha/beta hydrolase [Salibacterium aidingense]
MEKQITTNKGKSLHICDTPGEQGTIIAVHGLTGHHKQMQYYQRKLSGRYRVISLDMRGRGKSEAAPPETSIFTHANDVIDLIETMEIERSILMGYSMGGYVCALAAGRLQHVSKLILLDGAGTMEDYQRDLILPSLERLRTAFESEDDYAAKTKQLYMGLNITWNEDMETIARYEVQHNGDVWEHKSNYDKTLQDFESFYDFDPESTAPFISCSTLLVIAEGSMGNNPSLFHEGSYQTIQDTVSSIETVHTPVNHYELVFNEQPKILQAVESFLAKEER